ncbi:hypothetical protein ACHAWF_015573 [Thalassiosira exigua]
MEDGSLAKDDADNMKVMYPHFQKVFNNHRRSVDPSVLNLLEQHRTLWELDDPISWKEFGRAINKLKNGKAPGVPPEAFKAMDPQSREYVFNHIQDFWHGKKDKRKLAQKPMCTSSKTR